MHYILDLLRFEKCRLVKLGVNADAVVSKYRKRRDPVLLDKGN